MNKYDEAFSNVLRNFFEGEEWAAKRHEVGYNRGVELFSLQKRLMRLNQKEFEEALRSIGGIIKVYEERLNLSDEDKGEASEENVNQIASQADQVISTAKGEEIKAI